MFERADVNKPKRNRPALKLPEIVAGEWKGEFVAGGSVHLGHVLQEGPPKRSVEFSYCTTPAIVRPSASTFERPCVVMFSAPKHLTMEPPASGSLFTSTDGILLILSLEVERCQFTDITRAFGEKRLNNFYFSLRALVDESWQVGSWGTTYELA